MESNTSSTVDPSPGPCEPYLPTSNSSPTRTTTDAAAPAASRSPPTHAAAPSRFQNAYVDDLYERVRHLLPIHTETASTAAASVATIRELAAVADEDTTLAGRRRRVALAKAHAEAVLAASSRANLQRQEAASRAKARAEARVREQAFTVVDVRTTPFPSSLQALTGLTGTAESSSCYVEDDDDSGTEEDVDANARQVWPPIQRIERAPNATISAQKATVATPRQHESKGNSKDAASGGDEDASLSAALRLLCGPTGSGSSNDGTSPPQPLKSSPSQHQPLSHWRAGWSPASSQADSSTRSSLHGGNDTRRRNDSRHTHHSGVQWTPSFLPPPQPLLTDLQLQQQQQQQHREAVGERRDLSRSNRSNFAPSLLGMSVGRVPMGSGVAPVDAEPISEVRPPSYGEASASGSVSVGSDVAPFPYQVLPMPPPQFLPQRQQRGQSLRQKQQRQQRVQQSQQQQQPLLPVWLPQPQFQLPQQSQPPQMQSPQLLPRINYASVADCMPAEVLREVFNRYMNALQHAGLHLQLAYVDPATGASVSHFDVQQRVLQEVLLFQAASVERLIAAPQRSPFVPAVHLSESLLPVRSSAASSSGCPQYHKSINHPRPHHHHHQQQQQQQNPAISTVPLPAELDPETQRLAAASKALHAHICDLEARICEEQARAAFHRTRFSASRFNWAAVVSYLPSNSPLQELPLAFAAAAPGARREVEKARWHDLLRDVAGAGGAFAMALRNCSEAATAANAVKDRRATVTAGNSPAKHVLVDLCECMDGREQSCPPSCRTPLPRFVRDPLAGISSPNTEPSSTSSTGQVSSARSPAADDLLAMQRLALLVNAAWRSGYLLRWNTPARHYTAPSFDPGKSTEQLVASASRGTDWSATDRWDRAVLGPLVARMRVREERSASVASVAAAGQPLTKTTRLVAARSASAQPVSVVLQLHLDRRAGRLRCRSNGSDVSECGSNPSDTQKPLSQPQHHEVTAVLENSVARDGSPAGAVASLLGPQRQAATPSPESSSSAGAAARGRLTCPIPRAGSQAAAGATTSMSDAAGGCETDATAAVSSQLCAAPLQALSPVPCAMEALASAAPLTAEDAAGTCHVFFSPDSVADPAGLAEGWLQHLHTPSQTSTGMNACLLSAATSMPPSTVTSAALATVTTPRRKVSPEPRALAFHMTEVQLPWLARELTLEGGGLMSLRELYVCLHEGTMRRHPELRAAWAWVKSTLAARGSLRVLSVGPRRASPPRRSALAKQVQRQRMARAAEAPLQGADVTSSVAKLPRSSGGMGRHHDHHGHASRRPIRSNSGDGSGNGPPLTAVIRSPSASSRSSTDSPSGSSSAASASYSRSSTSLYGGKSQWAQADPSRTSPSAAATAAAAGVATATAASALGSASCAASFHTNTSGRPTTSPLPPPPPVPMLTHVPPRRAHELSSRSLLNPSPTRAGAMDITSSPGAKTDSFAPDVLASPQPLSQRHGHRPHRDQPRFSLRRDTFTGVLDAPALHLVDLHGLSLAGLRQLLPVRPLTSSLPDAAAGDDASTLHSQEEPHCRPALRDIYATVGGPGDEGGGTDVTPDVALLRSSQPLELGVSGRLLPSLEVLWVRAPRVRQVRLEGPLYTLRELHLVLDVTFLAASLAGLETLPNLQVLRLEGVLLGGLGFLGDCTSLRELLLHACRVSIFGPRGPPLLGVERAPALQLLSLAYTLEIKDVTNFAKCTSLRRVVLTRCNGVSSASIAGLEQLPRLTQLSLEYTRVNSVTAFAACPELTIMRLDGCKRILRSSIEGLERSPRLRELSLSGTNVVAITHLGAAATAAAVSRITSLDLSDCVHLDDAGVEGVRGLHHLEILNLSRTPLTTLAFVADCQTLTSLYVEDCPALAEDALNSVASVRRLRCLVMDGCATLKVAGAPLKCCPQLQAVSLAHCTGLDDTALSGLESISTLESLDLSGCTALTSASFLAEGGQRLRVLALRWCSGLREGTLAGLEQLPELADLSLEGLPLLRSVNFLARSQTLRRLSVRGCTALGYDGIVELLQTNIHLQL